MGRKANEIMKVMDLNRGKANAGEYPDATPAVHLALA